MREFFTRRGDGGETGLLGDERIAKSDLRLEVLGSIDEANSALGMARSIAVREESRATLLKVQRDLYGLMSEIATTEKTANAFPKVAAEQVEWLEAMIAQLTNSTSIPREFIVPGDTPSGAALDVARTAVRRAERRCVALFQEDTQRNPEILKYLNRLSSLCFVMELSENQAASGKDSPTFAKQERS